MCMFLFFYLSSLVNDSSMCCCVHQVSFLEMSKRLLEIKLFNNLFFLCLEKIQADIRSSRGRFNGFSCMGVPINFFLLLSKTHWQVGRRLIIRRMNGNL